MTTNEKSFWSEATESIDTFVQKTVFTAVFFIYIEGMIDIYSLAKNPLVFQKQRTITSAYIDVSGKMGIAQTVLMVQDNFTENFGSIKMDNFCVNEKGGYWAIYKAKFKFFKRPFWRDKVITTSFPADSAPIRTYENTAITTVEGEPIILAVQEACCLDMERHRPMKLEAVDFPMEGAPEHFLDNKFTKFPVTPEEYEVMKTHAEKGAAIVENLLRGIEPDEVVGIARNVANYHHERWDGTGYPRHLKGEEIPFESRIVAIADVYDALVSFRCYKEKMSYAEAFDTIVSGMGTQFDPKLKKYFINCHKEFEAYYDSCENK